MTRPKALVYIDDDAIEHKLAPLEKFEIKRCRHDELVTFLDEDEFDLCVLSINSHSASLITRQSVKPDRNYLFLSDGTPNPELDEVIETVPSYHFRTPYDFDLINTAIDEFHVSPNSNNSEAAAELSSNLDQFGLLVGSHQSMQTLYRIIHRIAPSDVSIFIYGESGVGKELVARTLHLMSTRVEEPFVALNCGTLSRELADSDLFGHKKGAYTGAINARKGVFERAEHGTLFLDEITEMSLELQVKLLRVLENSEYERVGDETTLKTNVRVIAACNRDPFEAIEEGNLREDLYFRLAQLPINVPPLRERQSDVIGLAQHFLAYLNESEEESKLFSETATKKLSQHRWPGNVRELKNTVHRAFLMSADQIEDEDIIFETRGMDSDHQPDLGSSIPAGVPLDEIEQVAIEKTLELNEGNKTETADQLGISVKTLYNKLDKYKN